MIHAAAHITGGGLIENLLRSIPNNLSLNLNLSKIKIGKIFKWLKNENISEDEMLKTFNCGVGFCLVAPKKNLIKITRFLIDLIFHMKLVIFQKRGNRVNLLDKLKW